MHWQFHGVFQKTLYTRKVADVTKLTDFTDLQTYRRCTTSSAPGPTRARTRSTTRSVAAAQERWQELCRSTVAIRSHARTRTRRAGAAPACGVVGRRGRGSHGPFWHTIFLCVQVSSRVAAILITLTLRVVEVELILEQKVLIFGVNPAVRLGSVRPGGGAGVRGCRAREHGVGDS